MKQRTLSILIGLIVVGSIGWFAFSFYETRQSANAAIPTAAPLPEVKECSSCTARHKAYSKAKKAWSKAKADDN